jgi:leucyl/phenylalanyl-tRNA--protein transferase
MLTADRMLAGYAEGIFPMAENRVDPGLHWIDPRRRGIIPLSGFHLSRSLARAILHGEYGITVNEDFEGTVAACADRPETWINGTLRGLYGQLHRSGHAQSLEVRTPDGTLVGGVFGVTLGGAFFGESMFSRRRDASKIALAYLTDRLVRGGFSLFDTQFLTLHLASLGAVEVSRAHYHDLLRAALRLRGDFLAPGQPPSPSVVVAGIRQRSAQTS